MVAQLESVMQPFDKDLARHYITLIEKGVLPMIDNGSQGEVRSTGTHAIKIPYNGEAGRSEIETAYRNGKIQEIADIPGPRVYAVLETDLGPCLVMDNMDATVPYQKLTIAQRREFESQYSKNAITMAEHGLKPTDRDRRTNCGFNAKTNKLEEFDHGHWRLNPNGI